MTFKLVDNLQVDWPVKISQPINGGKTKTSTFTAVFKLLNEDEFQASAKKCKDDVALIAGYILDWRDLVGPDDKPIPFTPENLKKLLAYPFIRNGIFTAYNAARAGIGDPETKN
jgi:hypothetical protein